MKPGAHGLHQTERTNLEETNPLLLEEQTNLEGGKTIDRPSSLRHKVWPANWNCSPLPWQLEVTCSQSPRPMEPVMGRELEAAARVA
ncbi:Os04g0676932 [Oryza sativa Japonica Group]|uniref:Os04g0676932 protein n=1 Tax=Oryza sativa subsp. japonica TaxID=39947 RepID=C7J1Y7_ORYSJ|nr:Os04g0676932 [Oryza sativa Japonica Group]|eukprot:NP_001174143.1 Os04g0676932 [Oryza sativa Japonica Group]